MNESTTRFDGVARTLVARLVLLPVVCLLLAACVNTSSSSPEIDGSEQAASQETIVDGRPIDVTGSTLDRNQQGVESAVACAKAEAGLIAARDGAAGDARAQLQEVAALAAETGISTYIDLASSLEAELDASGTDGPLDGVEVAAEALLTQCASDGFERLG